MRRLVHRLERIVRGEHHVVMAERADGAIQRISRTHPRRCHDDVVLDVLRRELGELHGVEAGSGAAVEAPEQKRQGLAQVAECELGTGKTVEYASEYDPQGMRSGLERPLPGRAS